MPANDLGSAVRRWRARVLPSDVGLPAGGRRRTSGLRREELALLAGVSVDYVVRIEQGRARTPSRSVVGALARALRLTDVERDLLYRFAGLQPPALGTIPTNLGPGVLRILDRLVHTPVVVSDAAWNLVEANRPWLALMGEPEPVGHPARNAVWRAFMTGGGRVRHTSEEREALRAAFVEDLRSTVARYPTDPDLSDLIGRLTRTSPAFRRMWESGVVGVHTSAQKVIDHPEIGSITLDCDVLSVSGSDLHLTVYTAAPGTPDATSLDLVLALGVTAG